MVNHEFNIITCDRIFSIYRDVHDTITQLNSNCYRYFDLYACGNLIIMSMGHYSNKMTEPLIHGSNTNYVDPLLQAIVLTAIVIGFAMTAFLLVLVYRTYRVTKEANIDVLRGEDENEQ